ncbi:MAG: hypothetical protein U0V04_13615 [Spirosomataceae bacterium]|jgi:hypothetical protein|nr:hypothetical protein [Bacteroidota bacterium]
MKKIWFLILCLFLFKHSFSQTKLSNFSISLYKGVSNTKCTIKNPFWLQQENFPNVSMGNNFGFEINQRAFKTLWIGIGMQRNNRNYTFVRINPYSSAGKFENFFRSDKGQDFSLKIEYFRSFRGFDFSILTRFKSQIWFSSYSKIFRNDGTITNKKESGYLSSSSRPRIENGLSIGHSFGKRKLTSIKVESNFSEFIDVRKSSLIDKMNLKSLALNFTFVKNFKPIL